MNQLSDLEVGAIPAYDDLTQGITDTFQSVFLIVDEASDVYDFKLKEGSYLSIFYRGSYDQSSQKLNEIIDIAEEKGYTTHGKPFEIYRIDNRFTQDVSEFLTEIQLRVEIE